MSRDTEASTFKRILGAIWFLIVCGVFLASGSALGWLGRSKLISQNWRALITPPSPQEVFNSDAETFLILGCDEDVYYHSEFVLKHKARSDMMMVARMDFASGEITGVSIPRDTWCTLEGYKEHKINAYYSIAKSGEESLLAKKAVESLIGVQIDKVVVIDYDAMKKLVDTLGGVYVDVPRKMDYDDDAGKLHIHLTPGRQKLDGDQALEYVRFRHSNDGKNETDFQRQQRQKDMLLGFRQAAVSNWMRMPDFVDAGKAVFGGALADREILALAGFARGLNQSKIRLGVIPTKERGNGLQVLTEKLPAVLAEYKLGDYGSRVSIR